MRSDNRPIGLRIGSVSSSGWRREPPQAITDVWKWPSLAIRLQMSLHGFFINTRSRKLGCLVESKAARSQGDRCNAADGLMDSVQFGKPTCRSLSAGWAPGPWRRVPGRVCCVTSPDACLGTVARLARLHRCTNLQGYLTAKTHVGAHAPPPACSVQRAVCSPPFRFG